MAINRQDVSLLFGVLGGGSISGESGALIKQQLESIVSSLNNKTNSRSNRIILNLDVAGTKSRFTTGLRQVLDNLNTQKQFKLRISEINATSAINKLRSDLNAMLRTLKVDTGFSVTMGANGATSAVKEIAGDAKSAILPLNEVEAKLKEITITNQRISSNYKGLTGVLSGQSSAGNNAAQKELTRLKGLYIQLETLTTSLRTNKTQASQEEIDGVYRAQLAIQELIEKSRERIQVEGEVAAAAKKADDAQSKKSAILDGEKRIKALKDIKKLNDEIGTAQLRWTAAKKGSTSADYSELENYRKELNDLYADVSSGKITFGDFNTKLQDIQARFGATSKTIADAGKNTKSLSDRFGSLASKFGMWLSVSQVVMQVVRGIKAMVKSVIEIDTVMTELKKVTNETSAAYDRFLTNASTRAKQLGATVADIVKVSADFARLGYSLEEASTLADTAIVYKNVGDGIEDISQASESIISTMKAFGIQTEDAMLIVDKFNTVGNNFAISSGGIGEALLRSASALAAANNSVDESIALITAANTVVQDPDSVGTAMKTISMYLRAAKIEAEAAGESIDGMVSSTSELRRNLLSLTGGKVDIMVDEDTFKSTYQILQELSKVWGELTDVSQANILEMIGGKRNSNVISALLENFDIAEQVIEKSGDAAGSALAENEKYLDSINGHIATFKVSFEELSSSVVDSDFVKIIIDLGSSLLSVVNSLAGVLDKLGGINTIIAAILPTLIKILGLKVIGIFDTLRLKLMYTKDYVTKFIAGWKSYKTATEMAAASTTRFGYAMEATGKVISTSNIILAAITVALSALSAIMSAISGANEEAMQAARDAASANLENAESLDEYKNKALELRDALASGNLSEKEAYENRKDLIDIQNELIDKYGAEAEGIDLVTGKINEQIDAINNLKNASWTDYRRKNTGAMEDLYWYFYKYNDYDSGEGFLETVWETIDGAGLYDFEQFDIGIPAIESSFNDRFGKKYGTYFHEDDFLSRGLYENEYFYRDYLNWLDEIYEKYNIAGSDHEDEWLDIYKATSDQYRIFAQHLDENADTMAYIIDNQLSTGTGSGVLDTETYQAYINASERLEEAQMSGDTKSMGAAYQDFVGLLDEILRLYPNNGHFGLDQTRTVTEYGYLMSIADKVFGRYDPFNLANLYMYNSDNRPTGDPFSDITELKEIFEEFDTDMDGELDDIFYQMLSDWMVFDGKKGPEAMEGLDAFFEKYGKEEGDIGFLFNSIAVSASEAGVSILDLYNILTLWGVIAGGSSKNTEKYSANLENMAIAVDNAKTSFEEVKDIVANIKTTGDLQDISSETWETLIEAMPEIRAAYMEYENAILSGNDAQEEQLALMEKLEKSANNFYAEQMASAFDDVVDAVDAYGDGSYQVKAAMSQLAVMCPDVVSALYDEEKGLYNLGNSANSARNSLLALANVDLFSSIVANNQRIAGLKSQFDALNGEVSAMTDAAAHSLLVEIQSAESDIQQQVDIFQNALKVFETSSKSGGGSSSKTQADTIKESFDSLSSSIKNAIQKQEEYFNQGKEALNSGRMQEALIRQIGYYRQIQREASTALEAVKKYYRNQGMSEGAIDQQSQVHELENKYLEATQNVKSAIDRMTTAIVEAFGEAVDSMQSVYDTLHTAADEFASSGYIAVDTLQEIISHGVEYLALLRDENGQLAINEENIVAIVSARTEQLAVETALAYVEAIHAAKTSENTAELNRLLYATQEATGATWGFVYAMLALEELDEEQYNAALNVIDSLRSLSESAQSSIGKTANDATKALQETREELEKMQTGVDDILQYTMDMIEKEIEQQIEALEEQKEAFAEYIDMQKEALDNAKEEADYEERKAEILKKLADLQTNIDSLTLVGTREADAEKATLLEEQAELQKELSELQNDHAVDAQKEALDKMQEAYEEEKNAEIEAAENSISSQQKLYDMALERIENGWDSLINDLIAWNYEYGSVLTEEVEGAWDRALDAAKEYGSYLKALKKIQDDIDDIDAEIENNNSSSGDNKNTVIGGKNDYDHEPSNEESIRGIISRMKENSYNWESQTNSERKQSEDENQRLADSLSKYGISAIRGPDGVWYIDYIGGKELYKEYPTYHTGGIVGGGDVKSNEQFALLKKREWILNEPMVDNLTHQMSIMGKLGDFASKLFSSSGLSIGNRIADLLTGNNQRLLAATGARPVQISIGDTYISGLPNETVKQHQAISKKFMDDLARQLGARW